jgi:hypothetical protein
MTTLKSVKEIQSYELGAQDGKIGRCNSFLIDDTSWAIRYIVGDTRRHQCYPSAWGMADNHQSTNSHVNSIHYLIFCLSMIKISSCPV